MAKSCLHLRPFKLLGAIYMLRLETKKLLYPAYPPHPRSQSPSRTLKSRLGSMTHGSKSTASQMPSKSLAYPAEHLAISPVADGNRRHFQTSKHHQHHSISPEQATNQIHPVKRSGNPDHRPAPSYKVQAE